MTTLFGGAQFGRVFGLFISKFHLVIDIIRALWVTIFNSDLIIFFYFLYVFLSVRHIIITNINYMLFIWDLVSFTQVAFLNFHRLFIFLSIFPLTLYHCQLRVRFWSLSRTLGSSCSKYCTIFGIISFHHLLYIVWFFGFLIKQLLGFLFLDWEVIIVKRLELRNGNNFLFYWLVKLYIKRILI